MELLILLAICGLALWYFLKKRGSAGSKDAALSYVKANPNAFAGRFPLLAPEFIEPSDQPLTAATAKRAYSNYMQAIGFCDAEDAKLGAMEFEDGLKWRDQSLRGDIEQAKADLDEAKQAHQGIQDEIKDLKRQLKHEKDQAKKDDLVHEVEAAEIELKDTSCIDVAQSELDAALSAYSAFKTDKRAFLVEFVNEELKNAVEQG